MAVFGERLVKEENKFKRKSEDPEITWLVLSEEKEPLVTDGERDSFTGMWALSSYSWYSGWSHTHACTGNTIKSNVGQIHC